MIRSFIYIAVVALMLPRLAVAEVSYEDILKNPDDVTLNQRFAQERLAKGDAKAALAAIERILVKEPANLPIRFLRARILVALGNDLQARGELEALNALPLPQDTAAEVDNMLQLINRRYSRWNSFASVSFGVLSGDNVNNFPTSGQAEINNSVQDYVSNNGTQDFGTAIDDDAYMSSLGLYTEYDLLNQHSDKIFINVNTSKVFGSDTEFMEYQTIGMTLGSKINRWNISFTPALSYLEIESETQPDADIEAFSLSIAKKYRRKMEFFTNMSANRRDYIRTEEFSAADNSDNTTYALTFGATYTPTPRWSITLAGDYSDIEARQKASDYNSKETKGSSLSLRGMVADGHLLGLTYRIGDSNHVGRDSGANRVREDDTKNWRVNYQLMGQVLHRHLLGLRFIAAYSEFEIDSNIQQYTNDRTNISLSANYSVPF